jgi:hypothetical protein
METKHGHAAWKQTTAWTRTCNKDTESSMDINMEMEHGHEHAAWTWNVAWTWTCSNERGRQNGDGHAE